MEDANYRAALALLIRSMAGTDYEKEKIAIHATRLIIGPTPACLLNVGFPALPVTINGRVVDKVYFDHGIPKGMLERLYSLICTPKAIYKTEQGQPGSVVMTYEMKGGNPIIVPIHPDTQRARSERSNVVASVYPKSAGNGQSIEVRWKSQGLLLWEP